MAEDSVNGSGRELDVTGPFGAPVPKSEEAAALRADELNLFDSTAVAVSSVAPAYSLASTLGLIFAVVGVGYFGPAIMIVSFVPVTFIAVAYFHLNRRKPDAGASYAWLSTTVSPWAGWFNGWVQIASSVLFCVSAPLLAGSYSLQFFKSLGWINDSTASSVWWTAIIGAMFLGLVTFICIYGIRWTTNFQWILVIIEYLAVLIFSIGGIIKVLVSHPKGSTGFHLNWMWPGNIGGYEALAGGVALAVFFFWGWDTSLNLSEESKSSSRTPGQAGVIAMFILLVVFILNFVAVEMLIPAKEIQAQGPNVLFYFGEQFAGHWAGYVMIFAVITSTVATTQTTLLPAARISYSMARDQVFPKMFASVHPKFLTPAVGTLALSFVALFGMLLTTGSSSVNQIFSYLISDIGVLVAFYYGATGLACAWAFRKAAFERTSFLFTGILLPAISALFMFWVGFEVVRSTWGRPVVPIFVVLGLGFPFAFIAKLRHRGDFFSTKPIAYETID